MAGIMEVWVRAKLDRCLMFITPNSNVGGGACASH